MVTMTWHSVLLIMLLMANAILRSLGSEHKEPKSYNFDSTITVIKSTTAVEEPKFFAIRKNTYHNSITQYVNHSLKENIRDYYTSYRTIVTHFHQWIKREFSCGVIKHGVNLPYFCGYLKWLSEILELDTFIANMAHTGIFTFHD